MSWMVCFRDGDRDAGVDDEQVMHDDEATEDYSLSPVSPPLAQQQRSFLSSSDDSLASTVTDVSMFGINNVL